MKIPPVRTCFTLPALLTLLSCGPEELVQPPGDTTLLTVGVPLPDTVMKNDRRKYAVAVSAESTYVVRMSSPAGNVDLKVFNSDTTFSQNWYCMVDMTGLPGLMDEYCILLASHSAMYLAVDASRLDTPSAGFTIEVQSVPLVALPISTPLAGVAPRGGAVVYVTDVMPGHQYVTGTTVLSDRAALMGTWGNSSSYAVLGNFGGPFGLTVETTGTKLYLAFDASGIATSALQLVAVTTPAAIATVPVTGTSGAVPAGVPTIGFVEPEGESYYYTEGMTPGEHLVSLMGLTTMANLRVFSDPLHTMENDCTALTPSERECKVTGASAYFSVRAVPLNHVGGESGAGYVLLTR